MNDLSQTTATYMRTICSTPMCYGTLVENHCCGSCNNNNWIPLPFPVLLAPEYITYCFKDNSSQIIFLIKFHSNDNKAYFPTLYLMDASNFLKISFSWKSCRYQFSSEPSSVAKHCHIGRVETLCLREEGNTGPLPPITWFIKLESYGSETGRLQERKVISESTKT